MKKKLDTDGDGEVSDEEKKAFRGKRGKRRCHKGGVGMKKRLLKKYDVDD